MSPLRSRLGTLALLTLVLASPGLLLGQDPPPAAPAVAPGAPELPSGYARVVASPHPHGTMVGLALRLPVGSADDPAGYEGTTYLMARALEARAAEVLARRGIRVWARVDRSSTVFQGLVPPDDWRASLDAVHAVLFDEPLPSGLVGALRDEHLERLRFQAAAPVAVFERERASLLVPPGSPWATPVRGTPTSIQAVSPEGVRDHRARWLRPADALLGLAGPLGALDGPATPTPETPVEADGPTAAPAWRVGDRTTLVRETTSAWLAVAYPVDPDLPRTTLELLSQLLLEELDPVPPFADRYSVEVEVVDPPGGPVLRISATVLPEALDRWEARVTSAVDSLAARPMQEDFFRWRRRRFRAGRLLAESAPEVQATRLTSDLALLGRVRDLDAEVWSLGPDALLRAVRALGEPRILRFGPDLAEEGAAPAR